MKKLVLLLALSLCAAGCLNQTPAVAPPTVTALTSAQQIIASAASVESSVAIALKSVKDGTATLAQSGTISPADQATVASWLAAIAKQNDQAIALTNAAITSGSSTGISTAMLAVASAIAAQPSLVDVKDQTTQLAVQGTLSAVAVLAATIIQEFQQ